MTHRSYLLSATVLAIVAGCSNTSVVGQPAGSSSPTATVDPVPTPAPAPAREHDEAPRKEAHHSCPANQFVACHDGKACTRRGGSFLEAKECYAHAADACSAASCAHGCNIYHSFVGGPKLVLCAHNASSSGHMKVCGGIANWGCPEGMRCAIPKSDRLTADASGTCVPDDA